MEEKELYKEKVKLHEVDLDPTAEQNYTTVDCPSCQTSVPAEHININDKIAKCGECDIVFSFDNTLKSLNQSGTNKKAVLRPQGIDIYEFKHETEITVKQPAAPIEILPFTVLPMFLLFSVIFYFKNDYSIMWPSLAFVLNIILMFYLYSREKHTVNIHINHSDLKVQWRPKKLISDKSYHISDIKQLYVKGHQIFMIVDGLEGSQHVNLIPGLVNQTQAHYLEQQIEAYLKIADEPVVGEDG